MYPSWSRVVHILSFSPFLYSHLHFEKEFSFNFPGFLIFRYYNCCEYESAAISNYITSSNLSVIQSPTAMSICANVESPPEVEEHEGRGHILIIMSDEEDEEPFCNSWHTVTAVTIFKMKIGGGPEWQGQLIAVQTQLLDVDKGLHIGDWPGKLETSIEMRILLESAILIHQRKPFTKIEETNEKEDEEGKDRFKKGKQQVKAPEPEEKPTAELNGHGLDEDRLNEKQPQQLHYLWLFSIIPVVLLLIGAFSYYRYKQKRNQLLARKTYIKVVYKADDSAGDVQWHESSQSASEEDKSTSSKNNSNSASKSRKSKKRSRSVKEFMHEYFERFSSD